MRVLKGVLLGGAVAFLGLVALVIFYSATPEAQAARTARAAAEVERQAKELDQKVAERKSEWKLATETAEATRRSAIGAQTLISAYERNEVAADANYKGRTVVVLGRVHHIGKDILGGAYVTLSESDAAYPTVQCSFSRKMESELAGLIPGETIIVQGKVSGKMMNIQLTDCTSVR